MTTPVERVTADNFKGQAFQSNALDHSPSEIDLGGKLAIRWEPQAFSLFGHLTCEPLFGQKQPPINPEPVATVGISQERSDLAHINLPHPAIVLTRDSNGLLGSFLIRTFVENQSAALSKGFRLGNFFANLRQDFLCRPRRVGHKVLHVLRRLPRRAPNVAEVTFCCHTQQSAQKIQRVMTGITCRSLKALGITFPEFIQPKAEFLDLCARQSPGARIEHFAFGFFSSRGSHALGMPQTRLFSNRLAVS